MPKPEFDAKREQAQDRKLDVKAEAQARKLAEIATPHNPAKPRGEEPNAGGKNRQSGDRSG